MIHCYILFAEGGMKLNLIINHTSMEPIYEQIVERENRELRRSNDILRQASAYFAKAEFDRLWKK